MLGKYRGYGLRSLVAGYQVLQFPYCEDCQSLLTAALALSGCLTRESCSGAIGYCINPWRLSIPFNATINTEDCWTRLGYSGGQLPVIGFCNSLLWLSIRSHCCFRYFKLLDSRKLFRSYRVLHNLTEKIVNPFHCHYRHWRLLNLIRLFISGSVTAVLRNF